MLFVSNTAFVLILFLLFKFVYFNLRFLNWVINVFSLMYFIFICLLKRYYSYLCLSLAHFVTFYDTNIFSETFLYLAVVFRQKYFSLALNSSLQSKVRYIIFLSADWNFFRLWNHKLWGWCQPFLLKIDVVFVW